VVFRELLVYLAGGFARIPVYLAGGFLKDSRRREALFLVLRKPLLWFFGGER
jgi:hypothetical protein